MAFGYVPGVNPKPVIGLKGRSRQGARRFSRSHCGGADVAKNECGRRFGGGTEPIIKGLRACHSSGIVLYLSF